MRHIVLVNPPHCAHDLTELGPPLGLLRLAVAAEEAGWLATIVDYNLRWHLDPRYANSFYETAVAELLGYDARVYAFTSMAVDTHVALRLATELKRAIPNVVILVGGVHFSSVADFIANDCPCVDSTIVGPGELALKEALSVIERDAASLPPVYVRPERAQMRPLLPLSSDAYRFVDTSQYLALNPFRKFDFEGARGCRYKCSFCYTTSFHGSVVIAAVDERVRALNSLATLGVEHVFFVEDNFLNVPIDVEAFCAAFRNASIPIDWSCYATAPQMTPGLISLMAGAGCRSLFMGIDAVGQVSERAYSKTFRRWQDVVRACIADGVVPTCAFLTAPPSHACGCDFEATIRAAVSAAELGASVRLNTLAYYPGTRLMRDARVAFDSDNLRADLLLDVPKVVEDNPVAARHPDLFPFHCRYAERAEWRSYLEAVHCLFTLIYARPDVLAGMLSTQPAAIIARRVLDRIGNLVDIPKAERRPATLREFDAIC